MVLVLATSSCDPVAVRNPEQLALRRRDRPAFAALPGGSARLGSRQGGPYAEERAIEVASFRMARTEVTVAQFVRFLEMTGTPFDSPQIRRRGAAYLMRQPKEPVTHVSYDQALAYAHWLARKLGQPVDLPTEDEWEYAARGGVRGAPYPWGWDEPAGRACFADAGPVAVGCFAANAWGLRDLAGNVAEWCRAVPPDGDRAPVRGGSWAERQPAMLHVARRIELPRGYRDADVGFRVIVREAP